MATRNPGKVREYLRLLDGAPFNLTSLDAEAIDDEVEESGDSFDENARLKAVAYAASSGLLTLADDSGLEVDALDGAPGVRSARYGGPGATDGDRVTLLLKNLDGVPPDRRTARFRCIIAIAYPSGEVLTVDGAVEGTIAREPRGTNGFGYDPVFYLADRGRTMAELSLEEKNDLSHRARAAEKAVALLKSTAGVPS